MVDRRHVFGWDIGGAHVKACRWSDGALEDVAQWPCPLWQGEHHLDRVLDLAIQRWGDGLAAHHAVTMTGEMVDLYADRADGVQRIAARLAAALPGPVALYARGWDNGDDGDDGGDGAHWVAAHEAALHWPRIASANWRATAWHAAQALRRGWGREAEGLLVDIGSTTTDLIALADGRPQGRSLSDRDRLATGELVYHGVVRTPLCALAPRITFQGQTLNVMHEFFATTADVYRLTGELDPAHDQQPSADGAAKTVPASRARLARMIGCDVRDGSDADWLDLALAWREAQVREIAGQALRVGRAHNLDLAAMVVVAAGCGAFLLPDVLTRLRDLAQRPGAPPRLLDYGRDIACPADPEGSHGLIDITAAPRAHDAHAAWARVCAPCVAVAALWDQRTCVGGR
ncbi:hydantoinase/oxoprolinase family protein [Sphaerotilus mobilis]|uniref:Putative H4MPT-linked C1 transfer pathway protein n=1 Tax=Sphaerotilus mobilis TaxID=47994 RepID=A0A4Q7LF37_9BURK|nr:hydantoinase/oxoprolinase family protein [Sphaerotilus mobilis]RZS52197.1 putative H4MPT-linked C1 transfer pathway protein [Sphaerotilus mobilis]